MKKLNWYLCSVEVGTRSPEDCKNRWELNDEANEKYRPWGDQEQTLVFEKMQQGSNWETIAGELWKREQNDLYKFVYNEIRKMKNSKFIELFRAMTMPWTLLGESRSFFRKNIYFKIF